MDYLIMPLANIAPNNTAAIRLTSHTYGLYALYLIHSNKRHLCNTLSFKPKSPYNLPYIFAAILSIIFLLIIIYLVNKRTDTNAK